MLTRRVVLGRVVDFHGLKGWVKIFSFTEPRGSLFEYPTLNVGDSENLQFESQEKGKTLMLRPTGAESREAAEQLMGQDIWVAREDMPPTQPGEYYWQDLEGCTVSTIAGETLGQLERMIATGANDVMQVRGEGEILIPFVQPQVVTQVDLEARTITVDWDPAVL